MKTVSALLFSLSFSIMGALCAQESFEAQPKTCACKDCKCSFESGCGCRSSGKTCSCGTSHSCSEGHF